MPIGHPNLLQNPDRHMSIAANMPDWQADCVRDAL